MKEKQRLISAPELAHYLGIHERTVRRRAKAKIIPCYHMGHRTLMFDLDEVLLSIRKKNPK